MSKDKEPIYLYEAHYIANTIIKYEVSRATPKYYEQVIQGQTIRKRRFQADCGYFDTYEEAGRALVDWHYYKADKAVRKAIDHIGLACDAAEDYDLTIPSELPYPSHFTMKRPNLPEYKKRDY